MEISIYTIKELPGLLESGEYRGAQILPVSPERIRSYVSNPRADPDDPVLFMLKDETGILAYRTLLPDLFFSGKTTHRFAWLSGNYVVPEQRRRGLSTDLFREVENAWNGRLMYTNYAPASKAVYDMTGKFREFRMHPGARYYLEAALEPLLAGRIGMKRMLRLADRVINAFHHPNKDHTAFSVDPSVRIRQVGLDDPEVRKCIEGSMERSLFRRGPDIMEWILDHPWITELPDPPMEGSYAFSWKSNRFMNMLYLLENGKGQRGFLWTLIHDRSMKVPYFLCDDPVLTVAARQLVIRDIIAGRASYLTIHHPGLGPVLGTRKNPFLFRKRMEQRFFAHEEICGKIPEGLMIHDGDGDCVFS